MAGLTITLPEGYQYVVLAGVSTVFLTSWQLSVVGRHRKRAGIAYPQLYAEKAEAAGSKDAFKFNCAQRAHQNTMETYPQTLLCLFLAGLKYPTLAAAAGATYTLGRVIYTLGYITGDVKKRNSRGGSIGTLAQLGLVLGAAWTSVDYVRSML